MEINILADETSQGGREANPIPYMVVEMKRDG